MEKFLEDDFILTRMKDEDITPSRARKLVYQFFDQNFLWTIGKRAVFGRNFLTFV